MTEGFGDRVKADALKRGDKISTLGSVPDFVAGDDNTGPRVAANDNTPLTVTGMLRDNDTTRVYNFEVESQVGEITRNYLVGEDAAWVHNGRGDAWKTIFNDPNTPKHIKGWIRQQLNRGRTFSNMLTPPGCDLGHHPSNRGSHGPTSRIEKPTDNRRRPTVTDNNPLWR